jgi:hypothetical protein
MAVVDTKNPSERNKLILAILLGVLAIGALFFAYGGSLFSSRTSATTKSTPTPKPSVSPGSPKFDLPTKEEEAFGNETTPIIYSPGSNSAPDAGRNIFAFYEPPPPTPWVTPSPTPVKPPPTPTPTPTPEFIVNFVGPSQSVYAGSKGFKLEINGDRFTPDARIYFNQTQMPTVYLGPQKLTTEIQSNLIAQEGARQIIVQTPDGKKYSNQVMLNVQAPPLPPVAYIGMIGRKRYNNDTAYFLENGKTTPFGARLNDLVGGRFRLINISVAEVTFEDTMLPFKHKVPLTQQSASTGGTTQPPLNNGFPQGGVVPNFPTNPNGLPADCIPGIPCNLPRYVPPQPNQAKPVTKTPDPKKDVDDNDDGPPK